MAKKKQVIMVESSPTDMLAKLSIALRKKGFETVLIVLTGNIETRLLKKAYNKRISFESKFFKINLANMLPIFFYGLRRGPKILKAIKQIKKLKPYVIIGRANPNWLCYLIMKLTKAPSIYFPYDIRSFCYETREEANKKGTPNFELIAEKYNFENSDGIIHKGADYELEVLNKKVLGKVKIKAPVLHFLPYCLEELIVPINKNKLSKKDKQLHLVFIGHISTDKYFANSIKMVLKHNIHLHLYGKTANLSKEQAERRKEYESFFKNKYFHLHEQVPQEKLAKEISKYDYGIWLGYYSRIFKDIPMAMGNKLASHLEAGLPTIYFKNHEFIGKICKEYSIGVEITIDSNLKKILKKQNYKKLEKNVIKARKDFEMHKQVPRIIRFFEKVRDYKEKRGKVK